MSNDKPIAIATIKFYPNKHVDVKLSTIKGITPRTLSIAYNMLRRKYRGMKGKFIAEEHQKARDEAKKEVEKAQKDEAEFHKKEDERLTEGLPKGEPTEPETTEKTETTPATDEKAE